MLAIAELRLLEVVDLVEVLEDFFVLAVSLMVNLWLGMLKV